MPNKSIVVITIISIAHLGLLLLILGGKPQTLEIEQPMVMQGLLIAAPKPQPTPPPTQPVIPKPVEKPVEPVIPKSIEKPVDIVEKVEVVEEPPPPIEEPIEPVEVEEVIEEVVEVEVEPVTEVVETDAPVESVTEQTVQTDAVAVITPPRVDAYQHNNPNPKYPRLSKRLGEEGTVILELLIAEDGSVVEVSVKQSSGFSRLDKAAVKAVKRWRYTPAQQGGVPMAYRYQQPLTFSL